MNFTRLRVFFQTPCILDIFGGYKNVQVIFLTLSKFQPVNASSTRIHNPNKAKGGVGHGGGFSGAPTCENVVVDFG